jgi:hypothetical protein
MPAARATTRVANPHLVYLDLNKWIDLAHAEAGTDKGKRYESALTAACQLVAEGRVVFPLSFAHFMEVAKIGNDTQRRTLARLMVRLSQGWFLASASSLIMGELRRAVALRFQKTVDVPAVIALTRSLKTVFINAEQMAALGDFDDSIFQSPLVLEEFLANARVGPSFVNEWKTFADNHERGRALRWDTSREVRKRAYCAVLTLGIQERLSSALAEFGLTVNVLEDLGPEGCVSLLESVPLLDVEINLHVERNEHKDRKIAPNDEVDLGFLSLAVPYCHTVITEKFWTSLVRRMKLDEKYGTVIGYDLDEVLRDLPKRAATDSRFCAVGHLDA